MTANHHHRYALLALWLLACSSKTTSSSQPASPGSSDPEPFTPDLTGLVPASSKWVLFDEADGFSVTQALQFLDLAGGAAPQIVNPNAPNGEWTSWSPDGNTFAFSGADASSDTSFQLMRLTDHGYVPPVGIDGFAGTPGNFSLMDWDQTSRFVVCVRAGSMDDGIEVVDTARAERVGHFVRVPGFGSTMAPAGYYFSMYEDGTPATFTVSRITKDGTLPPITIEPGAYGPIFDPFGQRAFTLFHGSTSAAYELHYLDLPSTEAKVAHVSQPGETFVTLNFPVHDGSIVVGNTRAGNDVLTRYYLDGSAAPVDISDPARDSNGALATPDGNLALIEYKPGMDLELARLDPYARFPLSGVQSTTTNGYLTAGVWGRHAYYQGAGQLHIASIDAAGALHDTAVGTGGLAATPCISSFAYQPSDKLAVTQADGTLLLLDLSSDTPTPVAQLSPQTAGRQLSCPSWAHDDSALAVVERGQDATAGSALSVVGWSGATPTPALAAFNSSKLIDVYALMYK